MNHVLTGKQFADKKLLNKIFKRAAELEVLDKKKKLPRLLDGRIVATIFYETSTRTRLSFESGALKLGAGVISVADSKTSSASKGESLEDAIKVISGYSDIVILRHPENGAAEKAAGVSSVPIINAGDGFNEHPTQALYDLYTIKKELGKIDGLKVAFLSDLRFQRNIHSLIPIFTLFKNLELYFVGPKELRLPEIYKNQLISAKIKFEELETIDEILPNLDVLYVARVFKERFSDEAEYERLKKSFFVSPRTLSRMKKDSIVLHVMPRVFEIDPEVDKDSRAAYFRQAKNGLYVRMALLLFALGI